MLDNIKSYLLNKIGVSTKDISNSLIESVINDNDFNKKISNDGEIEKIYNNKNDIIECNLVSEFPDNDISNLFSNDVLNFTYEEDCSNKENTRSEDKTLSNIDNNKSKEVDFVTPYNLKLKNMTLNPFFNWGIEDFQLGSKLGSGKFGKVYSARERRSGSLVAIKIISKKKLLKYKVVHQLRREIEIQTHLNHKNILKLYGVFWNDRKIFMILEFAPGGELYKELTKSVSIFC